jgi:hypothetical protein
MNLNKAIMMAVIAFLVAPLAQTVKSNQPNILQDKVDLTGEWVAESNCKGGDGISLISAGLIPRSLLR